MEHLELLEPLDHLEDLLDQEDHQVYLELNENVDITDFMDYLGP